MVVDNPSLYDKSQILDGQMIIRWVMLSLSQSLHIADIVVLLQIKLILNSTKVKVKVEIELVSLTINSPFLRQFLM